MSDWDVVGTAPAQLQDPWAVRTLAPAPPATTTSAKGGKQSPVDQLLSQEVTQGPQGFLNGIAELVGKGMGNLPMAAVHGILDIASRASGHGAMSSASPTFPLSPNAQEVSTSLGNAAAPAAPIANAVANAAPVIGQTKQGMEAVEGTDFGKQYVAPVVGDVQNVAAMAPGVGAVGSKIAGGVKKALAPSAEQAAITPLGLRIGGTGAGSNFLAGAAGYEGRNAVSIQNVKAATRVAGNQVGVPSNVPVNPTSLDAAKAAPGKLLDDAAATIPTGPLSPAAAAQVRAARGPATITKPTPNVANQIDDIESRLLDPNGQFTGAEIRATRNSLSSDAAAGSDSTDADTRAIAAYKRRIVGALDQHTEDTLPANGPFSADQVKLARATLAQNYTVGDLLKGPYLDLKGLGKVHADNPNLLTGDLRTLGQFAVDHPEVSGLPSADDRFAPPGYASGAGKALGAEGGDIGSRISRLFGIQPGATRLLTGNPEVSAAAARGRPVTGLGDEFAARPGMSGPTPGVIGPPPSRQGQLPLEPGTGQILNPTGGLTASPPTTSPPTAAGLPGQIPFGDLLAHGVEQSPAPGLSVGPMGTPAPQGIPFNVNAAHQAGGLSLGDELAPAARENNSQLGDVMSQGVPEGIVQRTPAGTRGTMQTIDFPSGVEHPSFIRPAEGAGGPKAMPAEGPAAREQSPAELMRAKENNQQATGEALEFIDRFNKSGSKASDPGSLHVIMQHMADNLDGSTPWGGFYKDLFGALADKRLATRLVPPTDEAHQFSRSVAGSFHPGRDQVAFTDALPFQNDPASVIAHEGTHAAIEHEMQTNPAFAADMTDLHAQSQKSDAVSRLPKDAQYGTTNPDEFIAEAASSRPFRNALKATPSTQDPSKSIWDQFHSKIGHVLKLSPTAMNNPLFHQVLTGELA
ncbi:MAG: hypothetical protein ACLQFI_18315 [Methylocella sp.]